MSPHDDRGQIILSDSETVPQRPRKKFRPTPTGPCHFRMLCPSFDRPHLGMELRVTRSTGYLALLMN